MEKAKANLESENSELDQELKQMSSARNESERKRKQADAQNMELQARFSEADKNRGDLLEKSTALQVTFYLMTAFIMLFHRLKIQMSIGYSNAYS